MTRDNPEIKCGHYCPCGNKIIYGDCDDKTIIECSCGRRWKVERVRGNTEIFEVDAPKCHDGILSDPELDIGV